MANDIHSQITSALEGSNFEKAEPLLAEFFASLEGQLKGVADLQERTALLQDALGWMHRWLNLSRVMRSHLNEQLRFNVRDASYISIAGRLSTVEFTG